MTWMARLITVILSLSLTTTSWAVIILDSTYKKSGFKKAEALAWSPQFSSLIFLQSNAMDGSGSWIANYNGHGYILTAGHMFPSGTKAADYTYETLDGRDYHGEAVFLHPLWNANANDRTGYDFAIVRLKEEVTTGGMQPALYKGSEERGKVLTMIGYGWRGTGTKGQDTSIETGDQPAAAQGLIESVVNAQVPTPKTGDAGNYLGLWLPKEDGSIPNPLTNQGITMPISPLVGILGSGDSGGPAWIYIKNGWVIAGINSDGNGNAAYGDISWFPRVSAVQDWIRLVVPNVRFIE